MHEIIEEKLKSLIIKNTRIKFEIIEIEDDLNLINDLLYDSLSFIQLIVDIEREFKIKFEDEKLDLSYIESYKNLKNYIIERLQIKKQNICNEKREQNE